MKVSKKDIVYDKATEYYNARYFITMLKSRVRECELQRIYNLVQFAVRWIVALDFFHETGEKEYEVIAKEELSGIYSSLSTEQVFDFKVFQESIVAPYFEYEKQVRVRILASDTFTFSEIEEFILRRSSDSLLYAKLAGYFYPLPDEVIYILHVRQLLEDIVDFIQDYEEDLIELQPNIFFMYLLNCGIPMREWSEDVDGAMEAISAKHDDGWLVHLIKFAKSHYEKAINSPYIGEFSILKESVESQKELLSVMLYQPI